ncbi:MAG: 23S rRNA (adenine(2503)-C(2))-methyltransferase RlmN [Phycisphaeraceae bacterium]|nr:MAG: 23S rRNA (adenine(2503)-C(2))-methyltransferase RlmN [Phycisphaeraceae bacterium]
MTNDRAQSPFSPLGLTAADFAARWKQAGLRGGVEAGLAAYSRFYRKGDRDLPIPVTAEIAPIVKRHEEPCDEGVTVKFCQRLTRKGGTPTRQRGHETGHSTTPNTPALRVGVPPDEPQTLESARLKTLGTTRRAADTLPLGILHADDRVEHLDIETVVIPMIGRTRRKTHTMCISSQIGCAMACDFCETGQMGLIRSLTAAEMVGQWWAARHVEHADINNIVFMGMGEPLDNLDAVLDAIACLTDDRGPAVPMSNITISTVGRVDGLRRLVDVVRKPGWKRLGLALSVNAPNDEVRDAIMPINRRWDMGELRQAMVDLCRARGNRKVLFEYVLIPGVNDADEHARQLAEWLSPFTRNEHQPHIGLLNVIPYNPRRDSPWPAPDEARVKQFVDLLADLGVFVKRRRTKGRDQMAACGQLGSAEIRKRRYTPAESPA